MGLTPEEHVEAGAKLKRAVRDISDVAAITRCYGRLSQQLEDVARGLSAQRGQLERALIEQVGANGMVEGVHVRDVYFGQLAENDGEGQSERAPA
jgi:hypothetical protein